MKGVAKFDEPFHSDLYQRLQQETSQTNMKLCSLVYALLLNTSAQRNTHNNNVKCLILEINSKPLQIEVE